MKGIVLAGGLGTRLYPLTKVLSKHLLPVYNKPMIYYPISILMAIGIRDIMIIIKEEDYELYRNLLKDGNQFGCCLKYQIQNQPNGIAQAFVLAEDFLGNENVALILGDNLFYHEDLLHQLRTLTNVDGAQIFAYEVSDPHRYGIVELNDDHRPVSIEEKPSEPKSNYAITGLYFYDNDVVQIAKSLRPSHRGEYEITDVNRVYLEKNKLRVHLLNKDTVWFDMGTFQSLNDASNCIRSIENQRHISIGSIELVAFMMKYIDREQFNRLCESLTNGEYGSELRRVLNK
ncbi:unnamed protein product [Adineta ricciae]|uniref:glucose-1-phosphate thymidylyltransferase n=1 Tax=Adineta ricciae TaxID=249248 RepID=A0A814MI81_ADIRI|nr:unnamed protein product [Adineta ricciae]CAF1363515.1 unnamed protein product [Adineta ricciae]